MLCYEGSFSLSTSAQTKSLWPPSSSSPARGGAGSLHSSPSSSRVPSLHCPVASLAESEFVRLPLRSVGGRGRGRCRSLGRCGTDCDWGHNLQWFFETKLSDASRKPVGRSAVSRLHIPLTLSLPPFHHSAYVMMPGPAAGELPRIVFLRTRGAIIIGTNITIASPQIYSRHPVKVKVVTVSCNGQPPLGWPLRGRNGQPPLGVTASRPWKPW